VTIDDPDLKKGMEAPDSDPRLQLFEVRELAHGHIVLLYRIDLTFPVQLPAHGQRGLFCESLPAPQDYKSISHSAHGFSLAKGALPCHLNHEQGVVFSSTKPLLIGCPGRLMIFRLLGLPAEAFVALAELAALFISASQALSL
jgi:hypothetical protein